MNNYLLLKISVLEHATANSNCRTSEDILSVICDPAPSPTPTATRTPTPTLTSTPTNTPTITPTNTVTPTNTATCSVTPSITATQSATPTITPTPTTTNSIIVPPIVSYSYLYNQVYIFNLNSSDMLVQTQKSEDNGISWEDIGPFVSISANSRLYISNTASASAKFRSRVFVAGSGSYLSAWSYDYSYSNLNNLNAPVINFNSSNNLLQLFNLNNFAVIALIEKSEDGITWNNLTDYDITIGSNSTRSIYVSSILSTKFRSRVFTSGYGFSVSDWSTTNNPVLSPTPTATVTPTITPTNTTTPTVTPTNTSTPTITPSVTSTITPTITTTPTITATITNTVSLTNTVTPTVSFPASVLLNSSNNWTLLSSDNSLIARFMPVDSSYNNTNINILINPTSIIPNNSIPSVSNIVVSNINYGQFIYDNQLQNKNIYVKINNVTYTGNIVSPSITLN